MRRLSPAEILEREPHISAISGLFVPQTGIVDSARVTEVFAERVREAGAAFLTSSPVTACRHEAGRMVLETPGGAGVRAQALSPDGLLLDDFCILQTERMIHVLNAPSPAATASITIATTIADLADQSFGLPPPHKKESG